MPRREPDGDATLHDLFPPVLWRQGHPGDVINPRPPTEEALLMNFPIILFFAPARARLGSDHDAVTRASGARRRA